MDIKYGVMVFNENEIYKDFYEELYARLAKIKGQDFYFTTNNPENDKFNYSNILYICVNSEYIESDNILSHFTFTLDVLIRDFNLVDITKEYAKNEEYKDIVFEFNFVLMFNKEIINRTYYLIDESDLVDNNDDVINNYINGNEVLLSNCGILIMSVNNDIWEVKNLLTRFLPRMADHVNFNKKNPASRLLKYRFNNILYATSDFDDIFEHSCFVIDHICRKIFYEHPYFPADIAKDEEVSHIRMTFISWKGIYNKELYIKLDYDKIYRKGLNKSRYWQKKLRERNLL